MACGGSSECTHLAHALLNELLNSEGCKDVIDFEAVAHDSGGKACQIVEVEGFNLLNRVRVCGITCQQISIQINRTDGLAIGLVLLCGDTLQAVSAQSLLRGVDFLATLLEQGNGGTGGAVLLCGCGSVEVDSGQNGSSRHSIFSFVVL